ncbi:MAG: hypothetical protein ACI9XO_002435 [Paraglaciecola sp.]|jgi:hypothetical protein
MKFSKADKLDIFENAISWIVVFAMYIYGGAKAMQFSGVAAIDKTVAEMTGMELMWVFYGYSYGFVLTLGAMEIIGGTLILFKKTRLLGCLFISAILVNVILQDIFYGVHVGALKAAILYQICILIILWLHKDKVIMSIQSLLISTKWNGDWRFLLVKLLIAFLLFVVLRVGEYWVTIGL